MQGDLKKTWTLINEFGGKVKRNIKASFVINGELVEDKKQIANVTIKSAAKKINMVSVAIISQSYN